MAKYLTLKEPGSIVGGWTPNSVKERKSMAKNANNTEQSRYVAMLERQLHERSLTRRELAVALERMGVDQVATKKILKEAKKAEKREREFDEATGRGLGMNARGARAFAEGRPLY
jgi:hypothetical protein